MGGSLKSSSDPFFLNNALSPLEMRQGMSSNWAADPALFAVEGGVIPHGRYLGFRAFSSGTASAPRTTFEPGRAVVPITNQSAYEGLFPGGGQVTHTAPSAQNRRDLVVARVKDLDLGDGESGFFVEVIDGAPGGSPVAPAVPSNAIPLWEVLVSTSGALTYTDRRYYTRNNGGNRIVRNAKSNTRLGSYPGDTKIDPITGELMAWVGNPSAETWKTLAVPQAWTEFAATLRYQGPRSDMSQSGVVGMGANASKIGSYLKIGSLLYIRYAFRWDPSRIGYNGGQGPIYTLLPAGFYTANREDHRISAHLWTTHPNGAGYDWDSSAFVWGNDNRVWIQTANNRVNIGYMGFYTIASTPGAAGTGIPYIPPDQGGFPEGGVLTIQGVLEVDP